MNQNNIQPQVQIKEGGDRVAVFGRTDNVTKMITVKSGQLNPIAIHLIVRKLAPSTTYQVKDIFGGKSELHTGLELMNDGFLTELKANGSTVIIVAPSDNKLQKSHSHTK